MPRATAPRVIQTVPRKRVQPVPRPIPPTLARYAPQMLLCRSCHTRRLADPNGIILWHGELRDDKMYDCGGYNAPGDPIPEEE